MTDSQQEASASPRQALALTALFLTTAWLAAGALAKMFMGNPKDIPEIVRDLSPFGLDLTFHLVIAAELGLVSIALLKPRLGWATQTATYLVFLAILGQLIAIGAESCGCGGGALKIHPAVMFAIDGSLLAFLLITKPWRSIRAKGAHPILLGGVVVAAGAVPWFVIDSEGDSMPAGESPAVVEGPWQPAELKGYTQLHEDTWVDQMLIDTALARHIDPDQLPTDGLVIFWRSTCDHCAEHLQTVAANDDFSQPITLIRINEKGDTDENRAVHVLPEGPHVAELELPADTDWLIETPYDVELIGGLVTRSSKPE